jgi:hypothetical protein
MVAGIEGDLVLRPLELLHIGAWLNGSNLVRELLEVAVGERCLSSAEDTSSVPTWLPVAPPCSPQRGGCWPEEEAIAVEHLPGEEATGNSPAGCSRHGH